MASTDTQTTIVVPVRDAVEVTRSFLLALKGQAYDRLIVLDNGSGETTRRLLRAAATVDDRVEVLRRPSAGIYAMWNEGFELAKRAAQGRAAFNVLVTNNDIELEPDGLAELAAWLRTDDALFAVYPDYDATARGNLRLRRTSGVQPQGGMSGSCFLLAGERITWQPLVDDPGYEWWFGDNHLARSIEEAGGQQARVVGLPVKHTGGATARLHSDELTQMINRDRRRWLDSCRQRVAERPARRTVPGTRLWTPRGARRDP